MNGTTNTGEIERVAVVGSGNVAEALVRALAASPLHLTQVCGRNAARVGELARLGGCGGCTDPGRAEPADLYLIAVSDRAVAEVAAALRPAAGAVVAHTAGSVALGALPEGPRAVVYPLQTFTRGRRVDFTEVPLLLEASDETTAGRVGRFARKLSRTVRFVDGATRGRAHLAGVVVCNFVNHLYAVGGRLLDGAGLPPDLLRPIIAETAAKALAAGNPAGVQTGPAVRGDRAVVERHLALLAGDPLVEAIYRTITQSIWETSRRI